MGKESSPFENPKDRTGLVCLGRVVTSDAKGRRLRVKTMGSIGTGTDDLDLYNVRILHGMWHPEGDEEVAVPRVGTYGVVLFLGYTECFWLGAVPLDMSSGENQRTNQTKLDPGDKVVKTIAGNKIIVRTGGTIEIQSTELCRTFWIPNENLLTNVCQNFELETSGGHLKWTLNKKEETTNLRMKVWNGLAPDNGVVLDIGTVPDANDEEVEGDIKPDAAADLVFDFKQGTLNEDDLSFDTRSLRVAIANDGSMYLDIGPEKFTLKIDGKTGDATFESKGSVKGVVKKDVNLTVEGQVTAKVTKDVTVSVDGKMTATVKKDVTVKTDGKASVTAKGGASVTTDGDAEITAKGNATVKATGNAEIKADGKATVQGTAGTDVGSGASPTNVQGAIVNLAGGGRPVALLGNMCIGVGNLGAPVISNIAEGSPKVTSG